MAGVLVAPVKDGKIQETESQSSLKKAKDKESGYSKDTFLKLLVAEVQNQDPLEPTSNTEWISQYATFSELEAMQNMSDSFDLSRASTLVGKTVVLQTTSEAGKVTTIQGKVDYVTYEGGKAYLSVNGGLYSIDDLHDVIDTDYMTAFDKVYDWSVALNKLPSYENLTLDDAEDVEKLYNEYDKMSDYEKTFVASENADKIKKYYEKIEDLRAKHEENNKPDEGDKTEETDKTEGTTETKPEESGENKPAEDGAVTPDENQGGTGSEEAGSGDADVEGA